LPIPSQGDERFVARRWDIRESEKSLDVPLWRRGFSGNTLEFLFSPTRNAPAVKGFFAKTLASPHTSTPRVITVDKNAAYPKAFKELKAERMMPDFCELRQRKYLNNIVEQDHRFIKRLVKLGMGFFFCNTAYGRGAPLVVVWGMLS